MSPWQLLFLLVEAVEAVMGCIEWTGSIHWCWMGEQGTSYRKEQNTLQLTSVTKRLMMNIQHLQKAGKPVGLLAAAVPKEHAEQCVGLLHCDPIRRSSKVQSNMLLSCTSHLLLEPMPNEPAAKFIGRYPENKVSTWLVNTALSKLTSNRFLNHLTVSSRLILCEAPTWVLHRRRLATRSPGRVMQQ